MKGALVLLIAALVLAGCGGADPVDDPAPAETAPVGSVTDGSDVDPGVFEEGSVSDEPVGDLGTADDAVAESDEPKPGTGSANVEDGTPNETRDPDVELPDLPAPTLVRPKYPNPEPVIPPPRD